MRETYAGHLESWTGKLDWEAGLGSWTGGFDFVRHSTRRAKGQPVNRRWSTTPRRGRYENAGRCNGRQRCTTTGLAVTIPFQDSTRRCETGGMITLSLGEASRGKYRESSTCGAATRVGRTARVRYGICLLKDTERCCRRRHVYGRAPLYTEESSSTDYTARVWCEPHCRTADR